MIFNCTFFNSFSFRRFEQTPKSAMTFISRIQFSKILFFPALFYTYVLNAQIPQNIKVEGEPADDWVSVLATFIIVVVLLSALLYVRLKRKNKK